MMQTVHSLAELGDLRRPVHWAMGFFDGVHVGHQRVILSADTRGALRGVLTFAQHPLALLCAEKQPLLLTPEPWHKAALIEQLGGADVLLVLPFTPQLADMSPTAFLEALGSACPLAGVSVGANWRFGKGGCGTAELLRAEGARRGFRTCVCDLAEQGGDTVCSSRIRAAVSAGQLAEAELLLGRPFALAGVVEHGQHLARRLGFPTANVALSPRAVLPPFGVYHVSCCVGGATLHGIANIGLRPTVDETVKIPRLEVHFPHWQGDLYGRPLTVNLLHFLRPERTFASLDELKEQVLRDLDSLETLLPYPS